MSLYILLVFTVLFLFSRQMKTETGTVLTELEFLTFDNVLYSPEELHHLTEEELAQGHVGWDYDYHDKVFSRVRTNRMILKLVPGETYGLYTEQLTYASKLWIDGVLCAQLGEVSDSPDGFVPRTGSVVVYFTAGEETEIVMQRCNFNHAKWNAVRFYYGPQSVITRQVQSRNFLEISYLGFLAALAVINLGMFAGMPEHRRFLWFSLACFASMIHQSLQDPKVIMQIFPRLDWYLGYRAEGISLVLMIIFLFLFMRECFGNDPCSWADPVFLGIFCLEIAAFAFLPTIYYTDLTVQSEIAFGVCCALYCILILVRIAKDRRSLSGSQYYYIAGILIFFLTAIVNIIRIGPSHVNTIRIGLIIFELTSTLALALEFSSVSRAYQEARAQETRLRMINASMEHTQEMQDNFMAIMNHEMRTPLTVIAGYAALNAEELKQKHPQDGEMIRNMQLIKNEALRMGRIVEQSVEGARATAASGQTEEADIRKIFEDARDFCRPICEKRENEIVIDCPEDLNVNCMRDSMLQLLYNLVINASRHTSKGVISLSCSVDGDHVLIKVSDDGEGMDEETRIHAFERGFSKDGGHGLGLALCKEIAEWHKGEIYIEPDTSAGTTVALKMPL